MSEVIVLDTGPVSLLCHDSARSEVLAIKKWAREHLAAGFVIYVPEIADYEVRRELLRCNKTASVARLTALRQTFRYIPLTTAQVERAAEMWAILRNQNQRTASDAALDADVILSAQAESVSGTVVATSNPEHIGRLVTAKHWQDIPVPVET